MKFLNSICKGFLTVPMFSSLNSSLNAFFKEGAASPFPEIKKFNLNNFKILSRKRQTLSRKLQVLSRKLQVSFVTKPQNSVNIFYLFLKFPQEIDSTSFVVHELPQPFLSPSIQRF